MRRTTSARGSGTVTASTTTPRGLAATAGAGATLLAAVAAPAPTLAALAAGLALLGVVTLLRSARPARERTETDGPDRTIHRLLARVAGAP